MSNKFIILLILVVIFFISMPCSAQARVTSIDSGWGYILALNDDGTVLAWGHNTYGELGIGVCGEPQSKPQKVLIDNVTAIAAAGETSYALKKDGTVWAWGFGQYGELGNGDNMSQSTPVQVAGLTNVTTISCGCALKDDGTVWAWGYNRDGSVGDGTTIDRWTPVQVKGLSNVTDLSESGSYVIKKDGTVWAWGNNDYNTENSDYGRLGDTSGPGLRLVPFQVEGISNIKQITHGASFTIYLKDDGTVWAWGGNFFGELGDGSQNASVIEEITNTPVQAKVSDIIKISSAYYHTIALKNDGTVWFWGNFIDGKMYANNIQGTPNPVKMGGVENVIDICSGYDNCFVIEADGSVWGWGNNKYGVLGNQDKSYSTPVMILKGSPVTTPTPTAIPSIIPVSPSPYLNTSLDKAALSTATPVAPTTTSGMNFETIAELCCLLITVSLLSGVVRRKYR